MNFIKTLLQLIKANHWIKNLYVFAPLFFSGEFLANGKLQDAAAGFFFFCLASSCIYIFNDLLDAENDRHHPQKKNRPIASGAVSKNQGIGYMSIIVVALTAFSFFLPFNFILVALSYIALNIVYSIWLKHIAIIDISIISIGFVLRVLAGGIVSDIPVSHWLVIMIYLLSMFLALAKRRDDLVLIDKESVDPLIRKSAKGYSPEFIQTGLVSMATVMIVCYIMYITSPEVTERLHSRYAYFNTFFVVAGVLKYLQIIFMQNNAGSPVKVIQKDRFIQCCVVLWLLSFAVMLYIVK